MTEFSARERKAVKIYDDLVGDFIKIIMSGQSAEYMQNFIAHGAFPTIIKARRLAGYQQSPAEVASFKELADAMDACAPRAAGLLAPRRGLQ